MFFCHISHSSKRLFKCPLLFYIIFILYFICLKSPWFYPMSLFILFNLWCLHSTLFILKIEFEKKKIYRYNETHGESILSIFNTLKFIELHQHFKWRDRMFQAWKVLFIDNDNIYNYYRDEWSEENISTI